MIFSPFRYISAFYQTKHILFILDARLTSQMSVPFGNSSPSCTNNVANGAGVSSALFLANRRSMAASTTSVADYSIPLTNNTQPQPLQPHERKKKTTLLRKLSEKRAHKYEFMQQQQMQQQQVQQNNQPFSHPQLRSTHGSFKLSSSSSSSSSSSLNNSFTNHSNKLKPSQPNIQSHISSPFNANTGNSNSHNSNKQRNVSTNDLRLSFYNNNNINNNNNNSNNKPWVSFEFFLLTCLFFSMKITKIKMIDFD